jgi:uncharacterized protein
VASAKGRVRPATPPSARATPPSYVIFLVVFVAYLFKASTGFGSAIVMMAFGSLVVGPVQALALVALLDVVGGAALLRFDTVEDPWRLWVPLVVCMAIGAAAGSLLVASIDLAGYRPLLGAAVVVAGVWTAVRRRSEGETFDVPAAARPADAVACCFAGFCGGLTSLSGPPLVLYFGNKFPKEFYRRTLTRVFLAEAIARVAVYASTGLLDASYLATAAFSLPLVVAGLFAGDRVFRGLSPVWFARVIGAAVAVAGVRLMV